MHAERLMRQDGAATESGRIKAHLYPTVRRSGLDVVLIGLVTVVATLAGASWVGMVMTRSTRFTPRACAAQERES